MKLLLKIVAVLVVLLLIVAVGAVFYIDVIAKNVIERSGTSTLGVNTTLDNADVGLRSAKFEMNGLRVANPEGFTSDHFMTLGHGDVNVSARTLMRDTVELPTLNLDAIDMNLERTGGKANYDVIMEHMKDEQEKPEEEKTGKRFVIRTVNISDITVHLDVAPVGGELTKLDLRIDEITLEDIGSDTESGVVLTQVWDVLLKAIFMAIVEKGAGIIPEDVLGGLEQGLSELGSLGEMGIDFGVGAVELIGEGLGEGVQGVGEGVQDMAEGAEKGLQDVGKGVGDLFGGDKEKDNE